MSKESISASGDLGRVQVLVDQLAADLDHSVAVDNPAFELICASAQIGVIDERRIAAIIDRAPPPEPVPWMLSFGIRDAVDPVRLPANPKLQMRARVCFPIRRGHELLGYLWLFDEPVVTDQQIQQARLIVESLATVMAGDDENLHARAEVVSQYASDILTGTSGALDQASATGHLPDDGSLSVQVVRLVGEYNPTDDRGEYPSVARLQFELHRGSRVRPFLSVVRPSSLTVIERARSTSDSHKTASEVLRAAYSAGVDVAAIGFADADETIDQGLVHARFASEVSSLLERGSLPLGWDQLGAWKLLAGWPLTDSTVKTISEDANLLLKRGTDVQWKTVLMYLDHARNTTTTSQKLFIHRATLHYRLERVCEILGDAALDDGWRTTVLHVALRLYAALTKTSFRL